MTQKMKTKLVTYSVQTMNLETEEFEHKFYVYAETREKAQILAKSELKIKTVYQLKEV